MKGDEASASQSLPDREGSPASSSLVVATDVVVPVRERALRIVFPRPDMQLVKRRDAVTVGGADELHQVTFDLRSGIGGKGARENDVLDGNEFHFAVGLRLVD